MDMDYIRQRRIKYQRERKIKIIATITLAIILLVLCIIWVAKMVADSTSEKEPAGKGTSSEQGKEPGGQSAGNSTTQITPGVTDAAQPTEEAQPTQAPQESNAPRIVIDAGHGGEDLGAVRGGYYEKDINLAIAKMVDEMLLELGYRTFMLRTEDVTIETKKRPDIVADEEMDLYVSIHQNTFDNASVSGTEVHYNEQMNEQNKALATCMAEEVTKAAGARNRGTKVGNNLIVLKPLTVPACLVECGYISSDTEREKLIDKDYQKKIAQGIVNAIVKFMPLPEE